MQSDAAAQLLEPTLQASAARVRGGARSAVASHIEQGLAAARISSNPHGTAARIHDAPRQEHCPGVDHGRHRHGLVAAALDEGASAQHSSILSRDTERLVPLVDWHRCMYGIRESLQALRSHVGSHSSLVVMAVSLATVLLFPLRLLFPASPSRGRVADTPTTTGSVVPPGMLGFESASSSALFLAACLAHHPHNDGPSVFLKALYEFQDSECTFLLCALLAKCRVADVHAHIDAVIDKEQQQTNASTDNSALPVHRPWRISFAGLFDALAKYDTKHDCIH